MKSPFLYDAIALKDNFFGRNSEIEEMEKVVKYSNNLLIFSKRRMGKTTLVRNFLERKKDEYICIYTDIFDVTSKEEFALSLLKALTSSRKISLKSAIKSLGTLFKRVRLEPTIDVNTLEYSIKPIIATLSFEQMMEDFFYAVTVLAKNQKIIIAIDEFQEIDNIKDMKLDAFLRKYIQSRDNISYIFLGSKRHLLTSLFEYKAPLFGLANHFELLPLKIEEVKKYTKKYLDINDEVLEYIYEVSDGETKLLLHILHLLFIDKKKSISKENIDEAISDIILSKDTTYRMLFDTLNNNQKLALKIIGRYEKGFFSQVVLNEFNIKKQTLKSSINSLLKKELIDKEDDVYFIPDRALELWVKQLLL
jgi:AAA+ ATPase superfamily predicted ATPase